uniref:Uncharacterized protein n=1 Tax=Arundo donax TaxID=35708 RepID=A0A0A9EZ54_ARUDO
MNLWTFFAPACFPSESQVSSSSAPYTGQLPGACEQFATLQMLPKPLLQATTTDKGLSSISFSMVIDMLY